jgi:hypothetical protein
MKGDFINKDNIYSLKNNDNYKNYLDCDICIIVEKYSQLIIEYINFIKENIKITKLPMFNFIFIRGLDTITNVFLFILYSTKNIELTYFHCQKSYYFYIEFVGQITEEEKTFLQLTTRDATNYVYKKTIYEINNEYKKNSNNEKLQEFREKLDIIKIYINLFQTYLLKNINSFDSNTINIEYLSKIYEKLTKLSDKSKIKNLEYITEKIYNKVDDNKLFNEINLLLIKKIIKNPEILKNSVKKIDSEEFDNKLLETPSKIVLWIIS